MMAKERIYCVFGYQCNNNCLFCAVNSKSRRNLLLSNADIIRFFDALKDKNDFEIEISGGEPTCRPELFYFLEYLHDNYPYVHYTLLTNGRNFSNVSLALKLSKLNPSNVIIPINADTPELHDQITQSKGSFYETMQGIRNLYDYDVNASLKTVVNGLNYTRLPQIVELVATNFFECPGITINGLDVLGRALINKDIIGVRLRNVAPYVEKAIDVANQYDLKIKVFSIPPCVLSEDYRKFNGVKHRTHVITKTPCVDAHTVALTYGTVEKCRGCRYFKDCTGSWYSYFDVYGTDELHPIE